jgi:ubiquinone/menaquinone biosynthesis C-methylase UbiE
LLATLPAEAVDSFAGVSTVSLFAELHPGMRVLDVGCGAGLDSLIAGRRVKSAGLVVGIDFSHAMLKRAKRAKRIALARNVCFCRADAERLPLETDSIDAVLVNGIFNLNPARTEILTELARVLKPGGALWAAELILRQPLSPDIPASEQDWFA